LKHVEEGSELVARLTGRLSDIVRQLEHHLDSQPQGRHAHLRALLTDRTSDIDVATASSHIHGHHHHQHSGSIGAAALTGSGAAGAFAGFALPSSASASPATGARRTLTVTPHRGSITASNIPFSPLGSPLATR
jgi:hypothetical protein